MRWPAQPSASSYLSTRHQHTSRQARAAGRRPSTRRGNLHARSNQSYSDGQQAPSGNGFLIERWQSSLVSHAIDERLGPICRPVGLVVEFPCVPHHLVHYLRQLDGVAGRARARRLEGPAAGVGHVRLVVRAVGVHSVPAPSNT